MAKTIMIQGTMSNVGKSLLTAGLCRIFHQDGYRTAPFKSQNMALNSFVTMDGLEISRAQAMQCEAAKIEPSVYMNPILLKPTGDMGSQVIVNGEIVGNMKGMDYFAYKKKLVPLILEDFQRLSASVDVIVIEGAGSPAEINLKQNDIVNMGLAEMVDAPVLLAGDIDRGGVFAQLLGTLILLDEEERRRVKGLIINKFRGDREILRPGLTMLEEKCGKKIFGVIPYVAVDIDEEDSQSEQLLQKGKNALIDIAVIYLPKISNFTDFTRWEAIDGVSVRYVRRAAELGNPDMILIPGSKNTMEDLLWLRKNGLEAMIQAQAKAGKVIFGICGGFQMMGEKLEDIEGVEQGGVLDGMKLLPVHTVFRTEKVRTRVRGCFSEINGVLSPLSQVPLEGYEIHMGESVSIEGNYLTLIGQEQEKWHMDGAQKENCYGTYVHGIFDTDEVAQGVITGILQQKGISFDAIDVVNYKKYKETQYDILADAIRENLDMERVYAVLEKRI